MYTRERDAVNRAWKDAKNKKDQSADITYARQLFMLTVNIVSKQNLFKVRRSTFFGIGWKRGMTNRMLDEGVDEITEAERSGETKI